MSLGFAELMNEKATKLNLSNTHFVTPHGLDNEDHYTTAYELALLSNYALKNNTFLKIVGTKNYTISINGKSKNITNTNELLGNLNGVYGVKTGFTIGANRCLVSAVKRDNLDIICIVLGADTKSDRTKESIKLIEYIFKNYKLINIKEKIEEEFNNWKTCNLSNFTIEKGISNNVQLTLDTIPFEFLPIHSNQINNYSIYIYCGNNFKAPLQENSKIGYISVNVDNKNILNIDIKNCNTIIEKNIFDYFKNLIINYNYYLESIFFQ